MKLTKYEHSCVLVEDADTRVLIDPGAFSHGFEDLTGLSAVLITHQHPDHLDRDRLVPLLRNNPDAVVLADPESAALLAEAGVRASAVAAGERHDVGTSVEVFGSRHAVIHPDIPVISNTGYLVGGRFFHPGDAFTVPGVDVEILGLPTQAPWQKLSEAVDYLRAVSPRYAVPIHEAVVAKPAMYYDRFVQLGPTDTTVRVLEPGTEWAP